MARRRQDGRQSVWDSIALLEAFAEHNIKPINAVRLWSHLLKHPSSSWHDVPELPKAAKKLLDEQFAKFTTKVLRCVTSSDGETTKLLIALQDGQQVESVIMHYDTTATFEDAHELPTAPEQTATEQRNGHTNGHSEVEVEDFHSCDGDAPGERQLDVDLTTDVPAAATDPTDSEQDHSAAQAAAQSLHQGFEQLELTDTAQTSQQPAQLLPDTGDSGDSSNNGATQQEGADASPASAAGTGAADAGPGDDCGDVAVAGEAGEDGAASEAGWRGSVADDSVSEGEQRRRKRVRQRAAVRVDGMVTTGMKRSTLCVSSQIGCQMGCTFCATGTMGLQGNLTAGEIVEQLVHANAVSKVRNIVFMGMGEPLANYEPVKAAVRLMTDSRLFALCRRHVTISTVGVIPRIKQLAQDLPGISLALSLHAPTQELRSTIVPSARAYPLDKLMQAVRQYEVDSRQRSFMEYVMLAGVNDGLPEAHTLGALLSGHNATLNLIPWNPVIAAASNKEKGQSAPMSFSAPDMDRVRAFQAVLREKYGIPTTVRQEKGQDISGACGQLVIQQQQEQLTQLPATGAGSCGSTGGGHKAEPPHSSSGKECGGDQHSASGSGCGTRGDRMQGSGNGDVRDIEELVRP